MFHKFVDLYGIVVFVVAVDGQATRADESSIFTVGVNADEGRILTVGVAVVGLNEILEAF